MMTKASKIVRYALAVGGFCAAMGVQAASAQNFFQMLFGGGQTREGRSAYQPNSPFGQSALPGYGQSAYGNGTLDPADPRLHREIRKRRAVARPSDGQSGSAGRQTPIQPTAEAPRGSLAYFEKDKTLRAGDVVVTNKGFLVFQGGDRDAKSFVAIDQSQRLKGDRKDLIALETVSRMKTPNLTIEVTPVVRDFIGPRLPAQMDARFEAQTLRTASR